MDEIDDMSDGSGDMSVGEEEPLAEETLTEFRAGLMHQRSNQLQADPRRGLVRLRRVRAYIGRGRGDAGGPRAGDVGNVAVDRAGHARTTALASAAHHHQAPIYPPHPSWMAPDARRLGPLPVAGAR